MASLASLNARLAWLQKERDKQFAPRLFVFVLAEDEAIPDETAAKIRPGDTVVIRQIPKNFLREMEVEP